MVAHGADRIDQARCNAMAENREEPDLLAGLAHLVDHGRPAGAFGKERGNIDDRYGHVSRSLAYCGSIFVIAMTRAHFADSSWTNLANSSGGRKNGSTVSDERAA